MLLSLEGIYRHGRVEIGRVPGQLKDGTRVIVTFLESCDIPQWPRGLAAESAAELRGALSAIAQDWDSPEMAAYDDYDAARRALD